MVVAGVVAAAGQYEEIAYCKLLEAEASDSGYNSYTVLGRTKPLHKLAYMAPEQEREEDTDSVQICSPSVRCYLDGHRVRVTDGASTVR